MADSGYRPRRGGGGGGFNNRKRRNRDDDDNYDGGRRYQRPRWEEPPATKLRKQVVSIAEAPHRRVDEDIMNSAKTIADNYFDSDLTNTFLDIAVSLTLEQPLKIPFIAAIVLQTNAQKPEFTEEVLKKLAEALQKNINEGCWREVKLLLRFLACLQGLFMGDGVFPFLEELFTRAAELQTASNEDALGLELVKIILFTVAYTMASSATESAAQAASLLDQTSIIASGPPHVLENLVDPYPSFEQGAPPSHESVLSLLQKHMEEEKKNNWELPCLPRPWKGSQPAGEEDLLASAQKHPFPTLDLPATLQIGPRQIFPEVYFSVYADQDINTVPPASDSSSLLIRDALTDAINVLHINRYIAGKVLIDMDCYFAQGTFVKRATAFDKIRELTEDKNTWKPEDVIVDATFSQLLQLPTPEHKPVFYHSVLTESCKVAPAAVAPSLGRAIRYLYRNIDRMDLEISQRFLDWFSHHLSNFGFTWKWTEWVDDVELQDISPKKAFILDALDKEIRLSFAQRIKGVLPEPYQALIAPEKEKDSPDFKFDDPSTPFADQAKELMSRIRQKASDEEIAAALSAIEQDAANSGLANPNLASTDAYMTCICYVGSKSLSHVLAVIERSRERLSSLANESPDLRKQIIGSVLEFWKHQIGNGVCLVDKLLNYGIVTPQSVVEWALVDNIDRGTLLTKNWCYELITKTISKVVFRVKQVVTKIRDPRLSEEERSTLQAALDKEMADMKSLFSSIEDAVGSVASASEDGMIESSDALRAEEESTLREWGAKWLRVFRRRAAVEESWVKEELAKPLPELPAEPEPKVDDVKMEDTKPTNGGAEDGRQGSREGDLGDGADGIE
ncbi:Nuclear cap-binding protein subunit 1 [Knufia obscura]|uniref:Nuclear cap-binding protein subunit 1 n=1 Tax=Knufia obscura TaxID=1635080 RepID=A0ABR0RXI7_9EURO|nr:Nuclear cap-binding protein subunit 1 [Knufia obscura]